MPEIELNAFSGDCLVQGYLSLSDGVRLTDFLNEAVSVPLTRVSLRALDDGRTVDVGDVDLDVDEICAVEATAGRGLGQQRIRTRTARVEIKLGPYEILGHLHGPTSGDPLFALSRRKRMIPLTEATIAYTFAGQMRIFDLEVIVINRDLAHMVEQVKYERGKIDDFGFSQVDPNAKDLTHEVYVNPRDE